MQPTTEANLDEFPSELCGYEIERPLTPDHSYLARGPGGRKVVLKKVDDDCMLRGTLHPSIHDRLSRVRELAHGGVANLHGVSRDGGQAYLIWEFVEGQTLGDYIASGERTSRDLLLLARELILCVESLHRQGIVHGALISENVIVAPDGSIRLTHISPLLYTDPAVDLQCVVGLLGDAVEHRNEQETSLGRLVAQATQEQMPLRVLGTKVAGLLESRAGSNGPAPDVDEKQIRRRMHWTALAIVLVGLLVGYGAWRLMDTGGDLRNAFHLFQSTDQEK